MLIRHSKLWRRCYTVLHDVYFQCINLRQFRPMTSDTFLVKASLHLLIYCVFKLICLAKEGDEGSVPEIGILSIKSRVK